MKTGSDVCHELFNILPILKSGVFVHLHDIFWPFEYSAEWVVRENRSWNELYGLRAFLMYNDAFEVVFFNDYFVQHCYDTIQADYPAMLKDSGGNFGCARSNNPLRDATFFGPLWRRTCGATLRPCRP